MTHDISAVRAAKCARRLAELLMKEMRAALRDPARLTSEEWDKLFGAKQSMISNLHKLVTTLAALPDLVQEGPLKCATAEVAMSPQEMAMLKAWLEERRD